ncbi:MAG: monooxygenase [Archangiaceae bacterium]|nr:monooxygenase [Archangiaceae bacterium]
MARLSLALVLLAACAAPEPRVSWSRDIGPLVQAKCAGCHVNGGIGPFPLTTFAEFMNVAETARLAIIQRRMPPWPASKSCAEYAPDGSLSDEQVSMIDRWLDDGALEGSAADFKALETPQNALSRVDLSVPMMKAFTPSRSPDEYRCFVLDWPQTETTYITGYALAPGNAAMIHHADIFFLNPSAAAKYRGLDPDGSGYTCYSLPVLEGGWIGTFVPGSRGTDFPDGSGLKVEPGSKIFIQTHYNTAYTGRQSDLSALNLRLEAKVRKPGVVLALADLKWMNGDMVIPAYAPDAVHRYEEDPTLYISAFNRAFVDGQPLKVWAGTLHMHQMGSKATFEIVRKDGSRDCITDLPRWDFHWQLPYSLAAPKTVSPGDRLAVECHWNNSQKNQPWLGASQRVSRELNWGAKTDDEMCVAGVYLTPQ